MLKQTIRQQVWEKSDGRCHYCAGALTRETFTVDHVIARSRGGSDDLDNLVVACRSCNARKYTGERPSERDETPFASWVTRLRDYLGWSRDEMATRMQVSPVTVMRWELGRCHPDMPLTRALARLGRRKKFGEPMPPRPPKGWEYREQMRIARRKGFAEPMPE